MKIKAQQSGNRPADKLLPTNVKSAKHQMLHEQAVKEATSGYQFNPNRKGKAKKRKANNKPRGNKKKKVKKGRAKTEAKADDCKRYEYPEQYDTSKIPKGLKSFHQLSLEDQNIFEAQLENEGIKYKIDLD